MGILWLVDGVLHRDQSWQKSQAQRSGLADGSLEAEAAELLEEALIAEALEEELNLQSSISRQPSTAERSESKAAKPPLKESMSFTPEAKNVLFTPPLPPPNSEIVAQPRPDLEHRLGSESRGVAPVSAVERPARLQSQDEKLGATAATVGELMSRDLVTVTSKTSAVEALKMLKDTGCHHLPVVNENRRLIGLVSDRDLLGRESDLGERMNPQVLTASPTTDLQEASQALVSQKFHSLVVIDEEQRPVGIVTSFDLLNYLVEHPAMKLWQDQSHTSTGA